MKKKLARSTRARSEVGPDDVLPEYDFANASKNPFAARFAAGTRVVVLDADVAAVFGDARTVNETLRAVARARAIARRKGSR